jgi:hypothetical protein
MNRPASPVAERTAAPTRKEQVLRKAWIALLALNSGLLILSLVWLIRGDPDTYHNEHARGVASPLTGVLLAINGLMRYHRIYTWVLLAAMIVSLGVSFWLAWR